MPGEHESVFGGADVPGGADAGHICANRGRNPSPHFLVAAINSTVLGNIEDLNLFYDELSFSLISWPTEY